MKKASRVLGIIGGVLALALSGIILYGAVDLYHELNGYVGIAAILLATGIATAFAGTIGIIGGGVVKQNNKAASVLMFIAAFLSMGAVIPCIILILGAIFALIREKQPRAQRAAAPPQGYVPVPPQGYVPAPPQGYVPQGYVPVHPQGYPLPPGQPVGGQYVLTWTYCPYAEPQGQPQSGPTQPVPEEGKRDQ